MTSSVATENETNPETSYLAIGAAFIPIDGFLGWQGAGMLAVIALPLLALARLVARLLKPDVVRLTAPGFFVLSGVFLLTWNILHKSWWMIGVFGWDFTTAGCWTDWLGTVVGLLLLAAAVRLAFSRPPVEPRL